MKELFYKAMMLAKELETVNKKLEKDGLWVNLEWQDTSEGRKPAVTVMPRGDKWTPKLSEVDNIIKTGDKADCYLLQEDNFLYSEFDGCLLIRFASDKQLEDKPNEE